MTKHNLSVEERLLAKMRKDPDGCWRWTGSVTSMGYGDMGVAGQMKRVHILAYETWVGPIPEGMDVGHKCHDEAAAKGECTDWRNCPHRTCMRPEHLKPESRSANLRSSPNTQAAINASKTKCKRGHEYTPENTRIKKGTNWRSCRMCDKLGVMGRKQWDEEHGV